MAQSSHNITLRFKGQDQVSATINKTSRGLQVMGKGLQTVSQRTSQATTVGGGLAMALGGINKGLKFVTNTGLNFANSLRLASQGMMSVGKAMTLFLTPVILIMFKKAADAAIGFDSAMVRVSKTTQLTGDTLARLAAGIRELAINTATSAVDLGKMAEQVGQLGVRHVPSILSLVETFNMLTLATEISADKVAIAMGKIANAFGIDLNTEEGAEQIAMLSSVINRLENELAAAAPEILTGLENFAQVASLIDVPPQTGAAMIAALVSVGFSAEEAGTALRNMTIKVVQNADQIAQLMKNTERYGDAQAVLTAINEDAGRVLIDLVEAASMGDDQAKTLFATIEAGGIRGGKAWAGMAGGIDTFRKALNVADDEWATSLSLIMEYEAALLSTENQMKVLRNNFEELAMTVADTFLPIMNTLIEVAIPAVRRLTDAFRALPPHVQKMIIVGALLLAVLGPMILFLAQIGFGLSMVMMSFMRMIQVGMSIVTIIGSIGSAISGLIGVIGGLSLGWVAAIAAIIGGIALLLFRFTDLGTKVANFFLTLGDKARAWGENLIATFGGGMLAGAVNVLAKVLTAIGNFIGRFLAGSSPPDVGPLSHIDKWGQNVFDAFLGGFLQADFSILSQVGSMIEKVLSTLAKTKIIGDKDQFKFALKARQDLAKLINIFNDTGQIAQDVLDDITANLGEASDEVQQLIRLWLDYNRIQKELADLEKQRESVLDTYRQEIQLIAQSNMTAEEKADAIRTAMRERDEELRILSEEEKELEKQKTVAEEQLEIQKEMISAMQHQDDIQLKLLDTLDKLTDKMDVLGDFAFPSLDELGTGGLGEDLENAFEPILTLKERIAEGEKAFQGFMDALSGAPFDETLFAELQAFDEEAGTDFANTYKTLWEAGNKLFGIWEKISGIWETAGDIWKALFGDEEGGGFQLPEMPEGGILEMLGFSEDARESMEAAWEGLTGWFPDAMAELGEGISAAWGEVWKLLQENEHVQAFLAWLDQVNIDWGAIWDVIGIVIGTVGSLITGTIGAIIFAIGWLIEKIGEGIAFLLKWPETWETWKEQIKLIITTLISNTIEKIAGWLLTIFAKVILFVAKVKAKFRELRDKVIGIIVEWLTGIRDKILSFRERIVQAAKDVIEGLRQGFRQKIDEIRSFLKQKLEELMGIFQEILGLGSPSKITMQYGEWMMEGLAQGITGASEMLQNAIGDTMGLGLETTQQFALQTAGAAPAPLGTPPAAFGEAGGNQITLQFGTDSVRSDRDIEDIADAVERVLAARSEGNISVGAAFGEEL
jgi:TP901 family phage tail tape measure protein